MKQIESPEQIKTGLEGLATSAKTAPTFPIKQFRYPVIETNIKKNLTMKDARLS